MPRITRDERSYVLKYTYKDK